MRAVLQGLVGSTIRTMTGKPNRVLRVDGDVVWVATARSPEGKPVEIRKVQAAADRLYQEGEIAINAASVGYRGAFIRAVLATLPGVVSAVRPRRIRLER
jgi:hypothetical protein